MDSNFQVKITVDVSDLQKRVSAIEKELSKISTSSNTAGKNIKSSFDYASSSIEKVGLDMNRARMATFAFGQVIRDAGFFQQSFGLGILSISNNIPILIDQLALASGVSAGFAAAISLVGSVLTAGLTVFAYWAQGVERDGGSVAGAIKSMALDSQSYLGQLVDYLSKPPASDILNSVIGGVMSGFEQIKQLFNSFVNLVSAIWNRFGSQIESVADSATGYLVDTLKNQLGVSLGIIKAFTAVLNGDLSGVATAIGNIFKSIANQIINVLTFIVSNGSKIIGGLVGTFDALKGEAIKAAGQEIVKFGNGLKFTTAQTKAADFNLKDWIKTIDISTSSTKKAKDATKDLNKEEEKNLQLEANKFAVKMMSIKVAQDAKDAVAAEAQAMMELNAALEAGLANDPLFQKQQEDQKQMIERMKEMNEWSKYIVQTVGGELVNAFTVMLETGQLSFGGVMKAIGDMIKKLIAAALAALVLVTILQALGIGKGIDFKKTFGMLSGLGSGGGGGQTAFADGGIVSGPTSALVGEYPGAKSNPEVIAPLDKLQGIISSSMGGASTPATLETRISGNDLVILMNRSQKNRNGYF